MAISQIAKIIRSLKDMGWYDFRSYVVLVGLHLEPVCSQIPLYTHGRLFRSTQRLRATTLPMPLRISTNETRRIQFLQVGLVAGPVESDNSTSGGLA